MGEVSLHPVGDAGELVVETSDGPLTCDARFLAAAMLIFIAKGNGRIDPLESATMISLLENYYGVTGAEALDLLTRAMNALAERPGLGRALADVAQGLPDLQKEDLAYMALKVIAADGKREAAEMEQFNRAVEATGIPPDVVHRAFDRFFAETMPEPVD